GAALTAVFLFLLPIFFCYPPFSRASFVSKLSRSPLSSPFGARAPARCSPGRGSPRGKLFPRRAKPRFSTAWHMQPVPSAQPWQQYVWPSCVYPSPGHLFLTIPQPGHAGNGTKFTNESLSSISIGINFLSHAVDRLS